MRDRHEPRIYEFNERFLFMTILCEAGRLTRVLSKPEECFLYDSIRLSYANVQNSSLDSTSRLRQFTIVFVISLKLLKQNVEPGKF